jgi:hypothetical protein
MKSTIYASTSAMQNDVAPHKIHSEALMRHVSQSETSIRNHELAAPEVCTRAAAYHRQPFQ